MKLCTNALEREAFQESSDLGSAKTGFAFMTETFFEHLPACIASSTLPTFDSYVFSIATKYKILINCWISVKFLKLHEDLELSPCGDCSAHTDVHSACYCVLPHQCFIV